MGKALSPQQRMRLATHIFNETAPAHGIGRVSRFIKEWSARVARTGIVADAPGRGRKSKLTPDMCKEAIAILTGGYESEGMVWPFADVRDAERRSARLRHIMAKAGVSASTLWRRCVAFDKDLTRKVLHFKPQLTPEQKRARVDACKYLLDMEGRLPDYLKRTFWIDAKKMYMTPRKKKVICRSRQPAPFVGHEMKNFKKQNQVVVHYYAVVNYFAGPVLYVEVSGTTGLQSKYKVRILHEGV